MQKVILIFLTLYTTVTIYTYDFLHTDKSMNEFVHSFIVYDRNLYFTEEGSIKYKIPEEEILIDENGYYVLFNGSKKNILIPGELVSNFFHYEYYNSDDYKAKYEKDFPSYIKMLSKINIESITSTSHLKENISGKEINYSSENLKKRYVADCTCHSFNYYNLVPPWVEGSEGDGIGEKLFVIFKETTDNISILNGYVNLYKRNLYKENNRLKKIKISSMEDNFEIEYLFDDYVYYADIVFPKETKGITIEILEVYNGTKYNDTCVSAIVGSKHNVSNIIPKNITEYKN